MDNEQNNEVQSTTVQPDLTVSDLQNIRALIETVARRNVFQINEFSAVGAVYDKLNNFLGAVAKSENQQG